MTIIFVVQPMPGIDENSPLPSPLPDKVQITDAGQSKAPVPKLDLSKAKKIQEQIAKKITQPAPQAPNENYNPKYAEKISQLEDQLTLAKKRLSHEMINNKLLSDEISSLHRQLMQISSTNEILIKSNRRYEEKWQKIFYTLEFYREFYHKYVDLITKGKTHVKSGSVFIENLLKMKEKFEIDLSENPEKLIRDLKRIDEENGNQIGVSILQAEDEEGNEENNHNEESQERLANLNDLNREQCKVYLLNLAKDLFVHSNLSKNAVAKQMLKKVVSKGGEEEVAPGGLKLRRSASIPANCAEERKKIVLNIGINLKEHKKRGMEENADERGLGYLNSEKDGASPLADGVLDKDASPSQIKRFGNFKKGKDEDDGMISFTVDAEEFNKNKLVEVSFISNNDILDHIKQE